MCFCFMVFLPNKRMNSCQVTFCNLIRFSHLEISDGSQPRTHLITRNAFSWRSFSARGSQQYFALYSLGLLEQERRGRRMTSTNTVIFCCSCELMLHDHIPCLNVAVGKEDVAVFQMKKWLHPPVYGSAEVFCFSGVTAKHGWILSNTPRNFFFLLCVSKLTASVQYEKEPCSHTFKNFQKSSSLGCRLEFLDVTMRLQGFLWWLLLLKLGAETTLAFTHSYDIDCLKQSAFRPHRFSWKSGHAQCMNPWWLSAGRVVCAHTRSLPLGLMVTVQGINISVYATLLFQHLLVIIFHYCLLMEGLQASSKLVSWLCIIKSDRW